MRRPVNLDQAVAHGADVVSDADVRDYLSTLGIAKEDDLQTVAQKMISALRRSDDNAADKRLAGALLDGVDVFVADPGDGVCFGGFLADGTQVVIEYCARPPACRLARKQRSA